MTATEKYLRSRLESEQRLRRAMAEAARESEYKIGHMSQVMRFLIRDAESVVSDPTPHRLEALQDTLAQAEDLLGEIDHQGTETVQ